MRAHWGAARLPGLLALLAFLILGAGPLAAKGCRADEVLLRGDWGTARFTVELAADDETRARGLMHRAEMARSAGMLFVYPEPRRVAFWMRNTLIPLDMLFMDEKGVVQRVHSMAVPLDETVIDGGSGIRFVLEINGGLAAAMGIGAGSEMRHPAVDAADAAWPCPARN